MNPQDPAFRYACILHFALNFREGNQDVAGQARQRVYQMAQLFDALESYGKPAPRPESDRTREVQVELDRLNRKADDPSPNTLWEIFRKPD